MSKYVKAAKLAVKKSRLGIDPTNAWKIAVKEIFPNSSSSQDKSCPKLAFLGLVADGRVGGIAERSDIDISLNGKYAINAHDYLIQNPEFDGSPKDLWNRIIKDGKAHNQQMDVVLELFSNEYLQPKNGKS